MEEAVAQGSYRALIRDRGTAWKLVAVLGLQMSQRFPAAFFGTMLTAIYRDEGLALSMLWVFTLPSIPSFLRPLWSPLVDRYGSTRFGRRRSWFVPCTAFGALAYASLAFFEPTLANLWPVIVLLTVKSFVMSTQDVAIDAYMVENLEPHERVAGSAVIDIARNVGDFVSFAVIIGVYSVFGWTTACLLAASLLILGSLPAILRPEAPPADHVLAAQQRGERPSLLRTLLRRDMQVMLLMLGTIGFAAGLIARLFTPYLVDIGLSIREIGVLLAAAVLIGTLLGASVAGLILNSVGYRRGVLLGGLAIIPAVFAIMLLGMLEEPSFGVIFAVALWCIFLPSLLEVALQACRLRWASKRQAGTDYTLMVVTVLAASSASLAIGGWLAEILGWQIYFLFAGVGTAACTMSFYALYDHIETLVAERDRLDAEVE